MKQIHSHYLKFTCKCLSYSVTYKYPRLTDVLRRVSEFPHDLQALQAAVRTMRRQAFRGGTHANHRRQIKLYTAFCNHYNLQDINPAADTVAMYIAYLTHRLSSAQSVANYVSGVRLLHKLVGVDAPALRAHDVHLMMRSVKLHLRRPEHRRLPFTPDHIDQLCGLCDVMGDVGTVMKVAILFGYYGMLRQSNLAPRSQRSFDHSRHTCRGDVMLQPPGIVILVKWAKTIQSFDRLPLIPIPALPGSPHDPVRAFSAMLTLRPTSSANDPLLMLPGRRPPRHIVTIDQLRRILIIMLECLFLDTRHYSLHSLRRAGATAAHAAGVKLLDIKRHGCWESDAVFRYITSSSVAESPVAAALASLHSQSQ